MENIPWDQALWTITLGIVGGVSCALLGCFLVLKRMSMLPDGISHGILPGIVASVMLLGTISPIGLMAGALAAGVLTALLAQRLTASGRVTEDSALGVAFTSMFALGLFCQAAFVPRHHLDCAFFGSLETAYLMPWYGTPVPRAFPGMLLGLAATLLFLFLFWKELVLATFDAALAQSMGLRPMTMHYLLVGLVALNTVTAFEAVGVVMVLAMFVVPGATARLLTDRLSAMLILAALTASIAAAGGYVLASSHVFNANVAGMIAVLLGVQFSLAFLFAPQHGLLAQLLRRLRLTLRIAREEILATLYRRDEAGMPVAPVLLKDHGLSAGLVHWAHRQLERRGLVVHSEKGPQLTPAGKSEAISLVRSHRLWETFLEKNFELPISHLHDSASQAEHFIGPRVQEELAQSLDAPPRDPHGRDIP
jgi:ABC-type Mn2+/Zn2+ transport system permease subunit